MSGARDRMKHYRTKDGAVAYLNKHKGSLLRRIASRRELALVRRLLARLGGVESVLDCACGAGRLLPLLEEATGRVFAVDQSASMIHLARAAHARVGFARADAAALPWPDRFVDAVVCLRLLHHFPESDDRVRILGEAARVARRAVIVSFADADSWKARRSRASRRTPINVQLLREEVDRAGLTLEYPVVRVGGAFSSLALVLARRRVLGTTA